MSAPPPVAASPTVTAAPGPPQAGIVAGIVLIVIGAAFLIVNAANLAIGAEAWPLWIVLPGLGLFVASLTIPPRAGLGLAMPGAILTMVGLVLWVQETYDLYATWAYAWALVAPTAPGLGMLGYGLVRGDRALAAEGLRLTLVGLGLFLGFALFFEGVIGVSGERIANLDQVLPVALIGLGILLVVLSLLGPRGTRHRV
jgi:hypothetical protein